MEHSGIATDEASNGAPNTIPLRVDEFQQLLQNIEDLLSLDDKNKIRIILQHYYKTDDMSEQRPLTESSERVQKLFRHNSKDGLNLLREMMFAIQRHDLLKKLGSCKHLMKAEGFQLIKPFRLFLLEIYDDIDMEAERGFLLETTSSENGNLGDCLMHLFASKLIDIDNVKYLEEVFSKLKMMETLDIVCRYRCAKSAPFAVVAKVDTYKMKQYPYGKYLIINNEVFQSIKPRMGTNLDRDALKGIFDKFGFVCDTSESDNLTAMQMRRLLQKVAEEDHSKYSAFICCILSHGKEGVVFGTDEIPVAIREVLNIFSAERSQHLAGKPKIFIIQSCQGNDFQRSVATNIHHEEYETDSASFSSDYSANNADLLVGLATFPGDVALRKTSTGSVYVNAFITEMEACKTSADMGEVFIKVCKRMQEMGPLFWHNGVGHTQIPIVSSTLSKKLVLKRWS